MTFDRSHPVDASDGFRGGSQATSQLKERDRRTQRQALEGEAVLTVVVLSVGTTLGPWVEPPDRHMEAGLAQLDVVFDLISLAELLLRILAELPGQLAAAELVAPLASGRRRESQRGSMMNRPDLHHCPDLL